MNIYLLTQDIESGYDTYNGAVVCADNEDEARKIHPSSYTIDWKHDRSWCSSPDYVQVELIGKAKTNITKGVILSSFNAG